MTDDKKYIGKRCDSVVDRVNVSPVFNMDEQVNSWHMREGLGLETGTMTEYDQMMKDAQDRQEYAQLAQTLSRSERGIYAFSGSFAFLGGTLAALGDDFGTAVAAGVSLVALGIAGTLGSFLGQANKKRNDLEATLGGKLK
ncbi:MAG: hypothetical protein KJ955_03495 [Nanoarchaeota archaeon]|nr:hypothetical protein [Nanoarchaeota archaeon]